MNTKSKTQEATERRSHLRVSKGAKKRLRKMKSKVSTLQRKLDQEQKRLNREVACLPVNATWEEGDALLRTL